MLPSFFRHSVTRIRPGTKDVRGSSVPDWDNSTTAIIAGCSVQPASTSLSQDGRVLGLLDGLTAFLPAGSDVMAGDRILYDGQLYKINGEPRIWPSASGGLDNIQLNLERWSG